MTEILPCPFCGDTPKLEDPDFVYPATRPEYNNDKGEFFYPLWQATCCREGTGCGAIMLGDSKEDAIKRWNTRV